MIKLVRINFLCQYYASDFKTWNWVVKLLNYMVNCMVLNYIQCSLKKLKFGIRGCRWKIELFANKTPEKLGFSLETDQWSQLLNRFWKMEQIRWFWQVNKEILSPNLALTWSAVNPEPLVTAIQMHSFSLYESHASNSRKKNILASARMVGKWGVIHILFKCIN